MQHLSLDVRDHVATVRFNRPPVNAVDLSVIDEFLEATDHLAAADVRAVVVTGNDRAFSAGADISMMQDLSPANHRLVRRWVDVQQQFEQLDKPVIAAIRGYALGGGAELALACDLRYLGQSSFVGFPEIRLGLFPGAGGTQRLTRLVGTSKAFKLMTEGQRLTGNEALEWGLVDRVVPDDDVVSEAFDHARRLASGPTQAIGLIKRCIYDGHARPLAEGLEIERRAVFEALETEDARTGLAAFLQGREPHFGRGRPSGPAVASAGEGDR